MATLTQRIADLAGAVRDKLNTMAPKLVPPGGTTGQVLTKTSAVSNAVSWQKPGVSEEDAFITALIFGG